MEDKLYIFMSIKQQWQQWIDLKPSVFIDQRQMIKVDQIIGALSKFVLAILDWSSSSYCITLWPGIW